MKQNLEKISKSPHFAASKKKTLGFPFSPCFAFRMFLRSARAEDEKIYLRFFSGVFARLFLRRRCDSAGVILRSVGVTLGRWRWPAYEGGHDWANLSRSDYSGTTSSPNRVASYCRPITEHLSARIASPM